MREFLVVAGVVLLAAASARAETPLERGRYLVNGPAACGNCHTPMGPNGPVPGMELAGGMPIEEPGAFTVHGPNITPDRDTGIGAWSDDQIVTAIREGRRPDGSLIGPPMPIGLYRGLSDSDVRAMVAYLRSVKPVRNTVPKSVYKIPLPPGYGPPVGKVADVPRDDPVAYGAYLVGPVAHCIECHTPMTPKGPDFANSLGAGGFTFHGPWGKSVSPNITSDRKHGIGAWSGDEIKRAITQGISAEGDRLKPPMPYGFYRGLRGDDLDAIVAYLRTLPPKAKPAK